MIRDLHADWMNDTDIIRGSGNLFRDIGQPDADRALLAARIIGVLDERSLVDEIG